MTTDPLARVATLTGVGAAAAHARDAIDALLGHPVLRRQSAAIAAESVVRGARASAELAGGDPEDLGDSVTQGALRATAEVARLAAPWGQAPGQVLSRLHVLAAKDVVAQGVADEGALGRPRPDVDRARFDQLLGVVAGDTAAPGVVIAALVHGELATIAPFGTADAVVARATERIVLVAAGVDTKAVSVPEHGHLMLGRSRTAMLSAYASGTPDGVAAWLRYCCDAYARGAEEGLAICATLS